MLFHPCWPGSIHSRRLVFHYINAPYSVRSSGDGLAYRSPWLTTPHFLGKTPGTINSTATHTPCFMRLSASAPGCQASALSHGRLRLKLPGLGGASVDLAIGDWLGWRWSAMVSCNLMQPLFGESESTQFQSVFPFCLSESTSNIPPSSHLPGACPGALPSIDPQICESSIVNERPT